MKGVMQGNTVVWRKLKSVTHFAHIFDSKFRLKRVREKNRKRQTEEARVGGVRLKVHSPHFVEEKLPKLLDQKVHQDLMIKSSFNHPGHKG